MFSSTSLACHIALVCALWSLAPVTSAQTATQELAAVPLDQLLDMEVSGASKYSTTIAQSAAAVSVITGDEIRAQGYRTLADVLSSIKGVMTTSDRTYSYIGVRGFYTPGDYNTRVLLLIDGIRVNDALFDQAYIGSEFPLDLANVERVEFVPGQGSAVYGANALFGTVNVVTRKPQHATPLYASVSAGSFGMRKVHMSKAFALGAEGVVHLSASHIDRRGEDIAAKGAVVLNGDHLRRNRFAADARWGDWRLTAMHMVRTQGMAVMLSGVPGDQRNESVDDSALYDLAWEHVTEQGDTVFARVNAGRYRYTGVYAFDNAPDVLNKDISQSRWWGAEARFTSTRVARHKMSVGAEMRFTPFLGQFNADISPEYQVLLDLRNKSRRAAIFVADQWAFSDTWTLDTSARVDSTQGYTRQATSRVALMWRPQPTLVGKLIYGTAYRPPNDFEAEYALEGEAGFVVNPLLTTERVRGLEFSVDWQASAADTFSASVYRNQTKGLIVQDFDPVATAYQFVNKGSVAAIGFEAEWVRTWGNGAKLRANVSHTEATESDSSVAVAAYAPSYLANAVLTLPVSNSVIAGLWWHAEASRGRAGPYSRTSLSVSSAKPFQGWSWSLVATNLFNRTVYDPGTDLEAQPTVVQARRNVQVRIGRDF